MSDRDGNVYALFGSFDLNRVEVFVGHKNGGWSSGCTIHEGDDRGAHGWVGRDLDRSWYWSGDALVEVSGVTGRCNAVLDRDPSSNANLQFQGVVPLVRETPSRTFTIALIQSPADRLPFFVVLDLDIQRYTSVARFDPGNASNVRVLGVGADPDNDTGFMVVKYELNGETIVEGLFLNLDGNIFARARINGAEALEEDSIAGYLHSVSGRVVAGVVRETGQLIVFDRQNGGLRDVGGMTAVGVHRWDNQLFVAGTSGSEAALSRLTSSAEPQSPIAWTSSSRFAGNLSGDIRVLDDRSDPRRGTTWNNASTGIGPAPFVSEHSPDVYALDTTGWLVAGPSFDAGGEPRTSVAFTPVGITYP